MRRSLGRGASAVKAQVRFGLAVPRWVFIAVAVCALLIWFRWLAVTRSKLMQRSKDVSVPDSPGAAALVDSTHEEEDETSGWPWSMGQGAEEEEASSGQNAQPLPSPSAQPIMVAAPQPVIRIYESSPEDCVRDRGWETMKDARCYVKMHEAAIAQTGGDPLSTANLCWGYAPPPLPLYTPGYEGGEASVHVPPGLPGEPWVPRHREDERVDGGGILFHMILLTGLGEQAPMTLVSWLATQCCNARLWVWSPTPVNTSRVDAYIPAAHRHRVVYKHLDVFAGRREGWGRRVVEAFFKRVCLGHTAAPPDGGGLSVERGEQR